MHTNAAPCRASDARRTATLPDGEDADLLPLLSFSGGIARQDESCLGKIHLTRERLHFVIPQPSRVGENGQRITRQRGLGEDVKLDEFVSAVGHKASLALRVALFKWSLGSVLTFDTFQGAKHIMLQ